MSVFLFNYIFVYDTYPKKERRRRRRRRRRCNVETRSRVHGSSSNPSSAMAKTRPLSLSISESLRKCNAGTTTTTTTTINNTRVRRRINSEKRCHYTFSETRNPRISYEDPSKPSWVEALVATLDKPEEGDDDDEITLDPRLRKDSLGFCQESKSPCDNSPSQSIHKNSVAFGQEIVCVDSLNWEDQKDSVGFGQRIRDPYEKILNQRFQSGSSGSGQESCLRLRKGSYREIQDQCENVSNRNCQKDSSEDPCGKVLSRRLRKNSSGFSREIQELCEKGEIARGLEILLHMDRLRILPCERDYFHLLKGCFGFCSVELQSRFVANLRVVAYGTRVVYSTPPQARQRGWRKTEAQCELPKLVDA